MTFIYFIILLYTFFIKSFVQQFSPPPPLNSLLWIGLIYLISLFRRIGPNSLETFHGGERGGGTNCLYVVVFHKCWIGKEGNGFGLKTHKPSAPQNSKLTIVYGLQVLRIDLSM